MKKTIFATLALGTAITFGGIATNEANAADVDYSHLAEQAKSNDIELNQKPIQSGDYDISFSDTQFTYHFWNNGGNFGYEYHTTTPGENETSEEVRQNMAETGEVVQGKQTPEQKVDQQQAQFDYQNEIDSQVTNKSEQPKQQEAPKVKQESTSKATGGTPSGMEGIVERESGGDPTAVNSSSGASGKYQFMQGTWDANAPSKYKGVSPAKVPESVQDQVASKLWNGGAGASHWAETV